jgi:holo-[acyl-carrier protein] synthase
MASKFASFPFPLGVGTDICRIQRIRRILDKRAGAKFITRILTEEERTAADRIIGPILAEQTTSPDAVSPGGEDQVASAANKSAARFLAGRYVPPIR